MNHFAAPMHDTSNGMSTRRSLLSLREMVMLAGVPEKRIRKDIETGTLAQPIVVRLDDPRLAFNWRYVVFLAAVYGNDHMNGRMRKLALSKLDQAAATTAWASDPDSCLRHASFKSRERLENSALLLDIDNYLSLNLGRALDDVAPRLRLYCAGLSRCTERPDVLGGEATFRGTRLSVCHVGKMADAGEPVENILEDYPYLTGDDVAFASLYYRAHPTIGRPRADDGADNETDAG